MARGRIAWGQLRDNAPRRRSLSRGQGAKATERRHHSQEEHRRWWLQVGQALMVGKRTSNTDHAYYAWIKANGFDDLPRSARKNAIWFASNIGTLGELPEGMASPGTIRQWANKRAVTLSGLVRAGHATGSISSSILRDRGDPLAVEITGLLGDEILDSRADLRRVAALLREAAISMQHSADLLREIAHLIQQPVTGGDT